MKLVIVSNRLPVAVQERRGKVEISRTVGGLATGLSSFLERTGFEWVWVGWAGQVGQKQTAKQKLEKMNLVPVFLDDKEVENFYYGFSNRTIWPLFHYFTQYVSYKSEYWEAYEKVNRKFAQVVRDVAGKNDIIWVHDYHLMLLPGLLRELMPSNPIGFFLHIPFPSFEVFGLLPTLWRRKILEGMLGADLVGFHTHDYTQNFLKSVLRFLGYEHELGKIFIDSRIVKVDTFPMGIDFEKFNSAPARADVRKEIETYLSQLSGKKLILSIDRLDYTKGVPTRLEGYKLFLEAHPEWRGKVVFLMVVVPSRTGAEHYQQISRKVHELVGEIIGKYGTVDWMPIIYQYKALPFDKLVALYWIADVILVTPIKDGMNLVAKEFVAVKSDERPGVLVLSEMAGASKELVNAIQVNPNSPDEIADAIAQALEMPDEEKRERIKFMQEEIKRYNVVKWGTDFIEMLGDTAREREHISTSVIWEHIEALAEEWAKAKRRLLLLDYDGTLVGFFRKPEQAKPPAEVIKILKKLGGDPKNDVVIVSGRSKDILDEWFGHLPVSLVAEHGAWIKEKGRKWITLFANLKDDWKEIIFPVLNLWASRLPGSFVEEKDFSLVWHYRGADSELANERARELFDYLLNFTANLDVQILRGNKVIEVRCAGVNKGEGVRRWVESGKYDFIFAMGDDVTDEDVFRILPPTAWSVKVGSPPTSARFILPSQKDVIRFLETFTKRRSAR